MYKQNLRLIEKREKAGLTQKELGNLVGLSQSMIAKIEGGTKEPRGFYKAKLSNLFQVTVHWLFYEEMYEECFTEDDKGA